MSSGTSITAPHGHTVSFPADSACITQTFFLEAFALLGLFGFQRNRRALFESGVEAHAERAQDGTYTFPWSGLDIRAKLPMLGAPLKLDHGQRLVLVADPKNPARHIVVTREMLDAVG